MIPDIEPVTLQAHRGNVTALAFSTDARTLVTGGADKMIRIWQVDTWKCVGELAGHDAGVTDVSVNRADTRLVSGSSDKSAIVWSFPEGALLNRLSDHGRAVVSVDISSDSAYVVTAAYDDTVRLWSLPTGKKLEEVSGNLRWLGSARFVPGRDALVTAGFSGLVGIWSIPEMTVQYTFDAHELVSFPPRVTADGEHLLSSGMEHRIVMWSTRNWGIEREIEIPCGGSAVMAVSPYDSRIAIVCRKWLHLLEPDGTEIRVIDLPTARIKKAAFSQDGEWLALAAKRGTVLLYPVLTE